MAGIDQLAFAGHVFVPLTWHMNHEVDAAPFRTCFPLKLRATYPVMACATAS